MAKSRGGSIVRGTSTYSRASQFRIAQAAAGSRGRGAGATRRSGGTSSSEARRAKVGAARAANNRTRRANAAGASATLRAARGFF